MLEKEGSKSESDNIEPLDTVNPNDQEKPPEMADVFEPKKLENQEEPTKQEEPIKEEGSLIPKENKRKDAGLIDPHYLYHKNLGEYPVLEDPEEIERLVEKIHGSDKEEALRARDELVKGTLRLVVFIVKDYLPTLSKAGMNMEDLIQEGNMELMAAAKEFVPSRGSWSTYASRAINNCMDSLITYHRRKKRDYRRTTVGIKEENPALQIKSAGPSEHLESIETEQQIKNILRRLELENEDPRLIEILRLRHGLDGQEALNLEEIGKKMGLSKERVRQLESKALESLREAPEISEDVMEDSVNLTMSELKKAKLEKSRILKERLIEGIRSILREQEEQNTPIKLGTLVKLIQNKVPGLGGIKKKSVITILNQNPEFRKHKFYKSNKPFNKPEEKAA